MRKEENQQGFYKVKTRRETIVIVPRLRKGGNFSMIKMTGDKPRSTNRGVAEEEVKKICR